MVEYKLNIKQLNWIVCFVWNAFVQVACEYVIRGLLLWFMTHLCGEIATLSTFTHRALVKSGLADVRIWDVTSRIGLGLWIELRLGFRQASRAVSMPAAGRRAVQLGCRQQRPRCDWLLLRLFISKCELVHRARVANFYWWKGALSNIIILGTANGLKFCRLSIPWHIHAEMNNYHVMLYR